MTMIVTVIVTTMMTAATTPDVMIAETIGETTVGVTSATAVVVVSSATTTAGIANTTEAADGIAIVVVVATKSMLSRGKSTTLMRTCRRSSIKIAHSTLAKATLSGHVGKSPTT